MYHHCAATACQATGASEVVEKLRQEIMGRHLEEKIEIGAADATAFVKEDLWWSSGLK